MPIILDPNKSFVSAIIYFIEETKKQGNVVRYFIKSEEDFNLWRSKGYLTREENKDTKHTKFIEKLTVHLKSLTWKEQNILLSQSSKITGTDDMSQTIDPFVFRQLKLQMVLKNWDAVDIQGIPVPITNETIDNMPSDLAFEICRVYEKIFDADEEQIKNL